MRYNININQKKCREYGLNADAGALMDILNQLSSWADDKTIDGETYYNLAFTKVCTELPLYFKNKQKVYRVQRVLELAGLIDQKKYGKLQLNYVKLTEDGKQWNRAEIRLIKNDEPAQGSSKMMTRLIKNDEPKEVVNTPEPEAVILQGSSKMMTYNNISITKHTYMHYFLIKDLKELAVTVGGFFGKSTEVQLMRVWSFLNNLKTNDKLDYFKNQMVFYVEYKNLSEETIHRFENFTRDWDSVNWYSLYKKMYEKVNAAEPGKPTFKKDAC